MAKMAKVFCHKEGTIVWANCTQKKGEEEKRNPRCTKCGDTHGRAL